MVDSLITLYEYDKTTFPQNNNGLGNLNDASKCEVVEELNGSFELTLEYPVTGIHYNELSLDRIIFCKTNIDGDEHAFRIYAISKPIGGIVVVNAQHISYDLSEQVISQFKASNSINAISNLNNNPIIPSGATIVPFSINSNINIEKEMKVKQPGSKRSLISGNSGSFTDTYGGEIKYSEGGTRIDILEKRGNDNDVVIEYGKNLTDLKQEENCANVYTHLYPYYYYYNESKDSETGVTNIDERLIARDIIPIVNMFAFEDYLNSIVASFPNFAWTLDADGRYHVNNVSYMTQYGTWSFSDSDILVEFSYLQRNDSVASGLSFSLYDAEDNLVASTTAQSSTDYVKISTYGKACKIKANATTSNPVYLKCAAIGITGPHMKVLSYDASSSWNNTHEWSKDFPSYDELDYLGVEYIKENNLSSPVVNLTVSFELLSQTLDYKDYSAYEKVSLGDTVTVRFSKMGVDSTARCVKTTYNVLTDKYSSIELGEGKTSDFSYHYVESQKKADVELETTTDELTKAFRYATEKITGNIGGYVALHDSNNDGEPDEILIMTESDIHADVNPMWRWNKEGLMFSQTKYDPEHGFVTLAITNDGQIVANAITTGTMEADRIHGGTLALGGYNDESGVFELYDSDPNTPHLKIKMDSDGMYFYDSNNNAVQVEILTNGTIKAGAVDAEDITGTTITGKTISGGTVTGATIIAGGRDDTDGEILVKNSSGETIIRLDNNGITFLNDYDFTISWSDVTDTEGVVTDGNKTTKIGKDYLDTQNIHAGSVDAEDITGTTITGKTISGGELISTYGGDGTYISDGIILTNRLELYGDGVGIVGAVDQSTGIGNAALRFYNSGEIRSDGRLSAPSLQTLAPQTSTEGVNCRLTTLDAQGGGTAGLVWYAAGSSIKFKHDFATEYDKDLDPHNLYDLSVYQYKYKTDYISDNGDTRYDTNVIGFIAEQVAKHYPIAVDWHYDKEKGRKVVEDWNAKYIVPPMLKLIQEQHDEIEALKKEIQEIKELLKEGK